MVREELRGLCSSFLGIGIAGGHGHPCIVVHLNHLVDVRKVEEGNTALHQRDAPSEKAVQVGKGLFRIDRAVDVPSVCVSDKYSDISE
jgi:hypothetical protein